MSHQITAGILKQIEYIEQAGDMFMYEYDYKSFVNYLLGFMLAEEIYQVDPILGHFHEFVCEVLNGGSKEIAWTYLIKYAKGGDEQKALSLLFELLKIYISANGNF